MLKQLRLQMQLKQRTGELETLKTRMVELEKRKLDLTIALEEAKNEEDIKVVEEQLLELEKDVTESEAETKKPKIEAEIKQIEEELSAIEEESEIPLETKVEERGKQMSGLNVRELIKTGQYYERKEVKEFYENFKKLRAVGGEGLLIPQVVVNRIMDIVGDYCTVYPLVNKIKVKGTTRILIDTDTTAATWIEQTGAIPEGAVGAITNIDFDGYKIGKATFVDNAILQDSIINIDDYVVRKLARAIALGLDLAIIKGEGATKKQPEGIITKLAANHKVSVKGDKLINIIKPIGLIDTGADSIGEITAVMHRSTYYNRLLGFSINTNSSGEIVGKLPNIKQPDLLGLRVEFNNNLAPDTILYGDYDKYTLIDREDISIDKSEHIKFLEDQMAYRGKGRFDGKPTNANAFVLVTITDVA